MKLTEALPLPADDYEALRHLLQAAVTRAKRLNGKMLGNYLGDAMAEAQDNIGAILTALSQAVEDDEAAEREEAEAAHASYAMDAQDRSQGMDWQEFRV